MANGNVLPHIAPNLPIFDPPKQKTFRAAVSETIRKVKADFNLSNVELSERIGCCADTISNAENENNDLSAVIILRLAFHFGEAAIEPIRQLYLCKQQASRPSISDRLRGILADLEE